MRNTGVVPTLAEVGVPDNFPVVVLKVAHEGLFTIAKFNL